jgi:hypothetical protein
VERLPAKTNKGPGEGQDGSVCPDGERVVKIWGDDAPEEKRLGAVVVDLK